MTTDVLKVSGNYVISAVNGGMLINVTNTTTAYSPDAGVLRIVGDVDIIGQTTNIESVNSLIKDNTITLNSGEIHNYVTGGTSGLFIARGQSDNPDQAATMLYRDNTEWTNSFNTATRGIFEFASSGTISAIRVDGIRIDPEASNLNILGFENQNAVIDVIGTVDYETRVLHDDDIPNKKYVDLAVYQGTDAAKRLIVGDTFMRIADDSVPFSDPYYGSSSKIWATINTSSNIVFRLEGTEAQLQGLTINGSTIQVNSSTQDLLLQPQAGQSVVIESPLILAKVITPPVASTNRTSLYYAGAPGGGGTGIFYVNTNQSDELVSRRRAIIYGIIF